MNSIIMETFRNERDYTTSQVMLGDQYSKYYFVTFHSNFGT